MLPSTVFGGLGFWGSDRVDGSSILTSSAPMGSGIRGIVSATSLEWMNDKERRGGPGLGFVADSEMKKGRFGS
jgi:hypothetical protein